MSPVLMNGVIGIGFVLAFQMAIIAAAQALPVLVPLAASEFDINPKSIGYFSTLVFATAILASNGTAGLLQRWGSIRFATITLMISGFGLLVLAASTTLVGMAVAAILLGIAYGPVNPAGSRLLIRVSQGYRRNFVFSIKQSSVAIGGAAAGALLPLIALPFGWRAAMVAMAAVSFIIALIALPVRTRLSDDGDGAASPHFRGPIGPARAMLGDPALRGLALSMLAFSAAQFGLMSIYVTFLWSRAGLTPGAAAAMLSVAFGASVAGRLMWGWLADSRNPIAILSGLAASGAVAFLGLLALSPGQPLAASLCMSLLLGFGPLSWSGVFLAEVAQAGVTRGGDQAVVTITAGMMVFGYLGGMLGPGSLSLSSALFGSYGPGTVLIALMLAASSVTLVRFRRTLKSLGTGG